MSLTACGSGLFKLLGPFLKGRNPSTTIREDGKQHQIAMFQALLRNLYAGQEATVRTRHGTTDWFHIRIGVHQGCILSPCLFNLYTEYIMRNPGLNEPKARIKIAEKNINNLRYEDDTTHMAESKEELK